jgi:MOSC domain-containing protein YiiM
MDTEIGEGARAAMHGRGGAIFRALTSGTIAVGDEVNRPG